MPARINHNVQLKSVHRDMAIHHADVARQIRQLSSGLRVNRSSDDPASLALADGINAELRAISEGTRNTQQTFALLQVAEGSLNEISQAVRRMQSLAMQAASSVFNDQDRQALNSEIVQLKQEIDRIATATEYNGKKLLTGFVSIIDTGSTAIADALDTGVSRITLTGAKPDTYTFTDNAGDGTISLGNGMLEQTIVIESLSEGGSLGPGEFEVLRFDKLGLQVTISGGDNLGNRQYVQGDLDGKSIIVDGKEEFTFQLGPAETSNDVSRIGIADMRATGRTLNLGDLSIITLGDAQRALTRLNHVQRQVVQERNRIGAFQNRLQLSIETSASVLDRMKSTESTIREVDVAKGATALARSQILSQVATSIAFEADTDIERVLSLLRS